MISRQQKGEKRTKEIKKPSRKGVKRIIEEEKEKVEEIVLRC